MLEPLTQGKHPHKQGENPTSNQRHAIAENIGQGQHSASYPRQGETIRCTRKRRRSLWGKKWKPQSNTYETSLQNKYYCWNRMSKLSNVLTTVLHLATECKQQRPVVAHWSQREMLHRLPLRTVAAGIDIARRRKGRHRWTTDARREEGSLAAWGWGRMGRLQLLDLKKIGWGLKSQRRLLLVGQRQRTKGRRSSIAAARKGALASLDTGIEQSWSVQGK